MISKVGVLLFWIIPCVSAAPMPECIAGVSSCASEDVVDASHISLLQFKMEVGESQANASQNATQPQPVHLARKKTITEVFEASGTDKLWRHGYNRYYETELAPYRDIEGVRILEIGAHAGKSLGAWMEYFTSPATVEGIAYGVDAQKAQRKACELMPASCDKLKIYSMDQSNVSALRELKEQNPDGWDIIVDDGSHKPQHQLISFHQLWPKLRSGGLYAIEDIETSYVENGKVYTYDLHSGINNRTMDDDGPVSAVEQFKRLVDVVNRRHFARPEFTVFAGVDQDVSRVSFDDGLIFVQKKPSIPGWDNYPKVKGKDKILYDVPKYTSRQYPKYEKEVEPVNSWFEKLESVSS